MEPDRQIARSSDRFPPELFIGTTIHYGTLLVITLFIICGVAALIANNPIVKWSAIIAGIFAWLLWLWPAFGSHPLAMPAFFALGSVILVVGTSLGIPLIKRLAARKNYPR